MQRQNNAILGGKKDSSLTASITTISDANFSVAANLPEMKVIDLLQGLFKMFNLVAYINDDDVIVVQTLDDYYAASDKLWDFTPYVDTTKSQVDSPIPFRQVNLGYESTKTFLAANFNSINNRPWGQTDYNEDSYFLSNGRKDKFEGETYEIKLPFEHMLFERLNDLDTGNLTKVQWGWHVDEKEQKSAEMPLVFYPIQPIGSSISARNLAGTKVTINAPYMPSNSASVFSDYVETGMSQSINFHAEIDEFALVSNEKTLFKSYYEEYIKDLFDERKRLTKLTAEIPMSIAEQLELNDDIRIFDKLYRINSITTDFQTNKSELELTNILKSTKFAAVVDALTSPITIFAVPIDISMTDITIDDIQITADNAGVNNNGFTTPPVTDPVPAPILQNIPSSDAIDPCVVTAPTLTFVSAIGSDTATTFKFEITKAGTLCDQDNVDEYGFLIADAESTLTATDDIDTLKADSNVQLVMVNKDTVYLGAGSPLDMTASSRIKEAKVTGLTHPDTKFARFYAKTNVNPDYDTDKNTITAVHSVSTDTGAGTNTSTASTPNNSVHAGIGSVGFDSIPSLADIEANTYTIFHNGFCGEYADTKRGFYHNGTERIAKTGDLITFTAPGGVGQYGGGTTSFQSIYGETDYFALAVGDNLDTFIENGVLKQKIIKHIVVEYATGEIVRTYDCALQAPLTKAYLYTSFYLPLAANSFDGQCDVNYRVGQLADFTIAHDGTDVNPKLGDQIRFTEVLESAVSTGFNGDSTNFSYSPQAHPNFASNEYHVLILVNADGKVRGFLTIQKSKGIVADLFYCT